MNTGYEEYKGFKIAEAADTLIDQPELIATVISHSKWDMYEVQGLLIRIRDAALNKAKEDADNA